MKKLQKIRCRDSSPAQRKQKKRLIMDVTGPDESNMFRQLREIFATQIAYFQNRIKKHEQLSSKEIQDLERLLKSFALLQKEIRDSQEESLDGLTYEEQLEIIVNILKSEGIVEVQ